MMVLVLIGLLIGLVGTGGGLAIAILGGKKLYAVVWLICGVVGFVCAALNAAVSR